MVAGVLGSVVMLGMVGVLVQGAQTREISVPLNLFGMEMSVTAKMDGVSIQKPNRLTKADAEVH